MSNTKGEQALSLMIQGSMLVQRCQNKGKSTKSEYNRPKSNLIMLGRKPKKINKLHVPSCRRRGHMDRTSPSDPSL